MPDQRKHRGPHPDDCRLFAESAIAGLRTSVAELSWLLSRDFAIDSALKLVGDRHELTARQRLVVRRCACSDSSRDKRAQSHVPPEGIARQPLGIDGYNVLITVESALSGGAIFVARDGCLRDVASVHGTYRRAAETGPALDLILKSLAALRPLRINWFFDRPVSNSGRLRAFLIERIEQSTELPALPPIDVELLDGTDVALLAYGGVVASSDSAILDRCRCWTNLAGYIIESSIPTAWKIVLRP